MTFLTWILAGLLAGLLAGWVMTRGSYGLKWDITLGIVGGIGGSWLLRTLGIFPGAGMVAVAVIAFMAATIPIIAQRKFFATDRPTEKKDAFWRWGLGAARGPRGLDDPRPCAAAGGGGCADRGKNVRSDAGFGEGEGWDRSGRSHRDEGRRADRERVRPDRHRSEAHRDAQAEEHVGQSDGPATRRETQLHRCPGTAHQARGRAVRTDPQVRHVRQRATRSRAGGNPIPGRGVRRRSPEGEEAEGNPPRVRVHPVLVPGGDGQLRRLRRPGQVSPVRWLHPGATSDSAFGAPTVEGGRRCHSTA